MISYRKAAISDINALIRLRIIFLEEVSKLKPPTEMEDVLRTFFLEHLVSGDYINWVAEDGNEIISTGGLCLYRMAPNFVNLTGNRGYIQNVYTVPAYRRKGISKIIFDKLMHEANDRQITQVALHATADGRPLYEQFGFHAKDIEMVWGKFI